VWVKAEDLRARNNKWTKRRVRVAELALKRPKK
jgi:hypothetical protein